jgi:hypothetical protein
MATTTCIRALDRLLASMRTAHCLQSANLWFSFEEFTTWKFLQSRCVLFGIPPKIPSLWAQLQRQEETRRVLRRAKLVVLLLVSVWIRCALRCEVLSRLLWHQRHGVAELFETVNMMTLDPFPIPLVKVISSQVSIRFLGT